MNSSRKELQSEVQLVVEVDGNPVGVLNLDMDRLWPLIDHRLRERVPIEWIDRQRFETVMRAMVTRNLTNRLQSHLYEALGDEIVKAQLDIESFILKAEAAAQVFGRSTQEIERVVADAGRTDSEFYSFFWEYLLDDSEGVDLKKQWKAVGRKN